VIGEQLADVAGARGAEDSICYRVSHGVPVRVSVKMSVVGYINAAETQSSAVRETMRVVTDADPNHAARIE
jgi:hypothetical protein